MDWKEVTIYTTTAGIGPVEALLEDHGVEGYVLEDAADFEEFLKDTEIYWDYVDEDLVREKRAQETCLKIYLPDSEEGAKQYAALRTALENLKARDDTHAWGRLCTETALTRQEDWEWGWKQYFKPFPVGRRFLIKPSWETVEDVQGRQILEIDPASSFGTGSHDTTQLCMAALEEADLPEPVTVWMKLDTGMHRLGVLPEQAEAFYQRLSQCKNVRQPVNVVSHFARADEPECGATERQLDIFTTFTEGKPGLRSIAASGGILLWPQSHFDWARPGIILYGVSPLDGGSTGADFGCQPVMSLTSSLIAVREHKAGEPVGYGGTWISERDTRLGVVAMGYGDGYPRAAPSGTPVLVNGREVPIVGRVAMDMICVDLGPEAQDKSGDPVVLWGEGLPVERIAAITKVSAYELITRLTSRVSMKYVD